MRFFARLLLSTLLIFVLHGTAFASIPRWPEPAWFAQLQQQQQQQQAPLPVEQGSSVHTTLTPAEQHIFAAINTERTLRGLAPLALDPALVALARRKSQDMASNGYFAHHSPTYGSPFEMMRAAGIRYNFAGENIARTTTPANAVQLFVNSNTHRRTLLNPRFSRTGIGVVQVGRQLFVTQMFIGFMR
ncbi:MAG: CAP domain-containing protein [Firmicutes bacterium]|nr:CAP domain-containing protein [Bacillota bacterium]